MISPQDSSPARSDAAPPEPRGLADEGFRLLVESVRDYAVFLLSPEGIVMSWNQGAQHIKGYRPDEIIGKHFSIFYPTDSAGRDIPDRELEVAAAEGRFEDEGWRIRKDGTRFWANVVISAVRGPQGTLKGFLKITRDLTERRRQEDILRQSEERFRLLVEGVTDYAIILVDPEGHVSSWNVGAQRIKGFNAEEILGRHISVFYPPEALAEGVPQRLLETARARGRAEDEGWRLRKDGSRFWANVILTPLHDREGRLRGFAKVTQDLTHRRRIEVLEEAGRRMNEFIAMLAHELRNPLAPIVNAVSLMRARNPSDPTLQWSRDVIERQANHLSRLVDDLLDVSRITSGRLMLHRESLDLSTVLDRAVEASRPLIEARGHALEVRTPEMPLWVEGDLIRLSQVVLNLLNNAAKYTPEGGRIWLSAAVEDGAAVIRVRDTGIGISADLLPKVFDIFAQGARSLDRSEGGLGIGLTLVQRLVTLHGGTVEAQSRGPDEGSEFIVRLPIRAAFPARPDAAATAPATEAESARASRRVLVVDDNRDATESMALLLGLWGHQTRTAHDGNDALTVVQEFQPEIVLLDIELPGMDGYEVARRILDLPGSKDAILVAMTGYGQEEDRRRATEAGFARHFVKPADPVALRLLLDGLSE